MFKLFNPVGILRPSLVKTNLLRPITKPSSQLWTIPNILTYTRIITTPFIGYYVVSGQSITALSLFTYSCITDLVDGYIARRFNMKSIVGSIIDPLADKFLMTTCTLALAYINSIPLSVASIIIGRDVILSFMSFYLRYMSLDKPRTFSKFVSIGSNPTISVHPNLLGKFNTMLQMVYIGSLVYRPLLESLISENLDLFFQGFGGLVGVTTVISGLTYVLNRNSWKYVK
ncbi:cardiolipin synthase [Spathaspora passalidarum NRRL Y-27907]|uniref:Cardiolipin synthase n=1 Tax=Spathaspora passalidarum (strain NRRL Y-27907 / 11-Y1) TaxID=619300 RepID=G3AGU9_SPAPN|nr:cardiolipin synthase [Spathaspora passalidarum NRRL Y-27907]EGW34622.1 cardiolipin synthase [Spathaspora passalidarum NRRL Y-27907]